MHIIRYSALFLFLLGTGVIYGEPCPAEPDLLMMPDYVPRIHGNIESKLEALIDQTNRRLHKEKEQFKEAVIKEVIKAQAVSVRDNPNTDGLPYGYRRVIELQKANWKENRVGEYMGQVAAWSLYLGGSFFGGKYIGTKVVKPVLQKLVSPGNNYGRFDLSKELTKVAINNVKGPISEASGIFIGSLSTGLTYLWLKRQDDLPNPVTRVETAGARQSQCHQCLQETANETPARNADAGKAKAKKKSLCSEDYTKLAEKFRAKGLICEYHKQHPTSSIYIQNIT